MKPLTTNTSQDISSILDAAEEALKPILSPRQPMEMVELSFSKLDNKEQRFALHWLGVIAVSNIELAYAFSVEIGEARQLFSLLCVEAWLKKSLSVYDREGLYPAIQILRDQTQFKAHYLRQQYVCYLDEVKPGLDIFIRGLAGRGLDLKRGMEVYTDTEHLYLPKSISRFPDKQQNKALYKSMACFLWAQTWYGTFKKKDYQSASTQSRLDFYEDTDRAKALFLKLENIRLLANIKRDLPGLHREMSALSPLLIPEEKTWKVISNHLQKGDCSVEDTFEALDKLMSLSILIPETDYQGSLNLSEIEASIEKRKNKLLDQIDELQQSQSSLSAQELQQALEAAQTQTPGEEQQEHSNDAESESGEQGSNSNNKQLQALLASLLQDVENLNQDMFKDSLEENREDDDSVGTSNALETGKKIDLDRGETSFFLDEWDYLRQAYRKNWCQVKHRIVESLDNGFKQQTQAKYPYLMMQIRRIFEAMRDQPRYANRQTDGEEFDLDALIDMRTASVAGEELSERLYIRRLNNERSVSVCLLVDMSGSTKGWINQAMRESLILFSEALNTLGDQYAIYGFSGLTRQRCEIYDIKPFSDQQHEKIGHRIGNIQAKDYTRMGFAIRFATRCLLESEARHRILLMLSDGKPDDYDGYQGEYGIQDTRQAIIEAQGHAINPYSITIDKQAQTYLPRLFGPGQYLILKDVSTLPLKLSEVYRKLSA